MIVNNCITGGVVLVLGLSSAFHDDLGACQFARLPEPDPPVVRSLSCLVSFA